MGIPNPAFYPYNANSRDYDSDDSLSENELMQQRHEYKMWEAVKALRNLPVVPLDFMFSNIIPEIGVDIEATRKELEKKGTLLASGWRDLQKDHSGEHAFTGMHEIHNQIISSTIFRDGASRTPTCMMHFRPIFAPISPTNARVGPDGCGQFAPSHPLYQSTALNEDSWFNTLFLEEYEGSSSDEDLKNITKKLLWGIEHLMNSDHRRRFVFALTLGGNDGRIWLFCRQTLFATRPFDLMKDPNRFIKIVSTLAYCSATQLGFDPNMELIQHQGQWNYRITITGPDSSGNSETKTYETTGLLSSRPHKIRGRATRIYEAYDVEDPEREPIVVKDSWVEAKRPREGDTLCNVLEGATAEERSFFLTMLQHGVVDILGRPDCTRELILGGYDITLEHHFEFPGKRTSRMKDVSNLRPRDSYTASGTLVCIEPDALLFGADIFEVHPEPAFGLHPGAEYNPLLHYRVVFREKGVSLGDMFQNNKGTLSIIRTAMRDVIQALSVMWKKRYSHRDISPGNIIMYNGRAKLSDLEFAASYGTIPREDIRIGTYDFMAVEVLNRRCLWNIRFFAIHNPLHDLESLWWVGVWCLVCHYSPNAALNTPEIREHITQLQMTKHRLFSSCADPLKRTRMEHVIAGRFASLASPQFSKPLQNFYLVLERIRAELSDRLRAVESRFPIDIGYFERPDFFTTIQDLLATGDNKDVDEILWPLDIIQKRQKTWVR
ncbi:hypothetical protein HYPSUDRAFT_92767 [Hypholoma sublateritium FD-334 SS-4]|uniref:Fungal-type protein kinase domain-containing protein n=1 Tax=Hypholoma sublateritium (strain FD-334 SS-4) TaxID=945553 RepID=A0A0D2KFZ5_HYPSF|nr:hypothetical protein HYPSUDRAFT_92767 [Hypholoma sublateritium FD-334 SS-4]